MEHTIQPSRIEDDPHSRSDLPVASNPPNIACTHIPVEKVQLSHTGSIISQGVDLSLDQWNRAYNFLGLAQKAATTDPRFSDPTFLILKMNLPPFITHYQHLTLRQLRNLASVHGISYRQQSKPMVSALLIAHECQGNCSTAYYVFKEAASLRPPWVLPRATGQRPTFTQTTDPNNHPRTHTNASPHRAIADQETDPRETRNDTEGRSGTRIDTSHLKDTSNTAKFAMLKEWQQAMDLSRFLRHTCAVCSELRYSHEMERIHADEIPLHLLRNDDLPEHVKPMSYDLQAYERAILDPEGLENRTRKDWMTVCPPCSRDLRKSEMPKLALANWLYYARDRLPEDVRKAFAEMSVFEKTLVSRVRTNSILCRFSGVDGDINGSAFASGRRHIRGNIISTPMDTTRIYDVLPPAPRDIADTIAALIVADKLPSRHNIDALKPILVRKTRVRLLIQFLLDNNHHYKLSESFRGFSEEHLDALFTGNKTVGVPDLVRIAHIPVNEAMESGVSDYTRRFEGLDGLFMENVSYTLGDHSPHSFREMTLQALQQCKSGRPFLYAKYGSNPVPDIGNPNWLSWAHPNADPFGIGGFHDPRRRKPIGMEIQLRHLLNVRDSFFENDPELAFDVYNICRKHSVNDSLRFRVPYSRYSRIVDDIVRLNKDTLLNLQAKFKNNHNYKPSSTEEMHILRTVNAISPVARHIPGTTAQKLKMRNEIRAVINRQGSPTLFVTLNPADYYNPIVTVLATRARTRDDLAELDELTTSERASIAIQHPVACAQFFDMMIKAFVKVILRHGRKGGGIFGECDAYYGTVETQGRGSLHCHMLIWLKGHLPAETLQQTLKTSEIYRTKLIQWLDSIVDTGFRGSRSYLNGNCDVSDDDLGRTREPHPGTISDVGPAIEEMDKVTFEKEMQEYTDDLLLRFNWHGHSSSCWKYLGPKDKRSAENCRFGMDGIVKPTTDIDADSGLITVRRRHPKMTQYNPAVTFMMKCNTDIKFIGSGDDAKAFMYYVTDYITKTPLSMHAGLSALSYAIQQGENRGLFADSGPADIFGRKVMTTAINSMLGRQEISHPQVMSYISGQGENYTSEKFQAFNWGEILKFVMSSLNSVPMPDHNVDGTPLSAHNPNNPTPPPSPPPQLPTTPAESSGNPRRTEFPAMEEIRMSVGHETGEISVSNQLLDYIYRPEQEPYNSMCLYNLISSTTKVPRKDAPHPSTSARRRKRQTAHPFSSGLHPQYHSRQLNLRANPVVPVLLGPRIAKKKGTEIEKEEWARDMCILFKPWRNPTDLKAPGTSWLVSLEALWERLSPQNRAIMDNMSLIAEGKSARDSRPRWRRTQETQDLEDGDDGGPIQSDVDLTELNAFQLVEQTPDILSKQLDDLLNTLIGAESTSAFRKCIPSRGPNTSIPSRANSHQQQRSDSETLTRDVQQAFMLACKNRGPDPREAIIPSHNLHPHLNTQRQTLSRDRRSTQRGPDPSASITTLGNSPNPQSGQLADPWGCVKAIIEARSMKDNREQLRSFEIIAHHLIEGGPQLLMFVGGKGGTGKSYLIASLVMLFEKLSKSAQLRLGAPTGIAASLIGGNTLHSLLHITPGKRASTNDRLPGEWRSVKYLIVDEVSMVGATFLATLSSKLKAAKADASGENSKMFGGVNLIFMGDFYQLSPPKQPSLFAHRLVRNPTFTQIRDNNGIDALSGAFLWRQVDTVVILKKSHRHADDPKFAEILERIRTNTNIIRNGELMIFEGKTILEHLREREITRVAACNPSELALFEDAPVIVGSKIIRDTLNACLLVAHARRLNEEVLLHYSVDAIRGKTMSPSLAARLRALPTRTTKEILGSLPLFIGMKVMITENISVPFKIVNGSEGTVVAISTSTTEQGDRIAEVVYVRIPGCAIEAPGLDKGVVPIFPTSVSIDHPMKLGQFKCKTFRRRQIPLVPAYSYTDYKSQGRTLPRAIVDISSARGQGIYVMLSRVTTLKGLLILRWFPNNRILQKMSDDLKTEINRLNELDCHTLNTYNQGLYTSPQQHPTST